MKVKQRVMLIILDGLGAAPKAPGNAVVLADPKNLSTFWNVSLHTYLLASGEAVGLPKNVKGNSEVGHLNIGAGSVVKQNLARIDSAIEKGLLEKNNTLKECFEHAMKFGSKIHVVGLLSDGGVHSTIEHFKQVIGYFAKQNFPNDLLIHAFTDGRDTPTNVALNYFTDMEKYCTEVGLGKIATFVGRYYGMDRNQKWDRTEKAYRLLTENIGEKFSSCKEAIENYYSKGLTDEFLEPAVLNGGKIESNDVVIFMNFRADRVLQITESFVSQNFNAFSRNKLANLFVTSMVEYRKDLLPKVIFPRQFVNYPLGKILETMNLKQLRVAESEKFPHVTYFFNGGTPQQFNGEDRIVIPSPRVPTYDLKPEMSAFELTSAIVQRIPLKIYDFILVNFANTDMVGHTGNLDAGIKSVKVVDECVKILVKEFTLSGGVVIITSDHGNVEEMVNLTNGNIDTEHSLNPVPLIISGIQATGIQTRRNLPYGALKDIAPTILEIMGLGKPSEMTGDSLLKIC